jgi:hypothetical protein
MFKCQLESCKKPIRMDKGERMRKREGKRYHLECYLKLVTGK